jgi:hypothetical protein
MEKNPILDPGSAVNIMDHISKSLITIIWKKKADPESGSGAFFTPGPVWKNWDPGSWIEKIPDPGSAISTLDHIFKSLVTII